ncbi:hypothetical protein ACNKHM_28640 [Shigella sonnei]
MVAETAYHGKDGGDAHDQQALDYALYHLAVMTPARDQRSSVAKGLSRRRLEGLLGYRIFCYRSSV